MSLKSGTNSFHGVGYEFYRRKWLDANSFQLNAASKPKVDHYLDQYGFSVDGPVLIPGLYNGKGKTFFLFTGEKYREGTPAPQFSTVPTEAMRRGDFSNYRDTKGNLITIYDPATGRLENGAFVRSPFPNNQIPAERFNPVAVNLLQYIRCRTTAILPSPSGRTTWRTPNTSTRTCSGTGSAKSTTTSDRTTGCSPVGQERAQRDPEHHGDPQRSGAEWTAAADPDEQRVRR